MLDEFLDWFEDFLNGIIHSTYEIMSVLAFTVIAILTLPLWLIPFVFWFFFERRKSDGRKDM